MTSLEQLGAPYRRIAHRLNAELCVDEDGACSGICLIVSDMRVEPCTIRVYQARSFGSYDPALPQESALLRQLAAYSAQMGNKAVLTNGVLWIESADAPREQA